MDATARAISPAEVPATLEDVLSASAKGGEVRSGSVAPRRKRLRDRLLLVLLLLFMGALSTVAISWLLAFHNELDDDLGLTGQGFDGRRAVSVQGWSGFGSSRVHLSRSVPNWSILQALGPPDTPGSGDIQTAWASTNPDSQKEWLILDYAKAVVPKQVDVHETYNPGALEKVSVFDESGQEVVVWQGSDPTPVGSPRGISSVPVNINFKTSRVKIYLDSPRVSGWNEIDTVGLIDAAGKPQWPVNASASSSYGRISAAPNAPTSMTLLPEWCPIANADSSATGEVRNNEVRVFEARGWPMLAMWGERDLTATSTTAQAQTASGMGSPGPPMSSAKFSGLMLTGGTTGTAMAPMLPARPIWRGFLVNTLVMAILLRVVYLSLAVPRRFVMELARMRRGCCLKCGYELGFDFRAGCPECGWRRAPGDSRPG